MNQKRHAVLFLSLAILAYTNARGGEQLEQIISHETPDYNNRTASLTVGRDGRVYLSDSGRTGDPSRQYAVVLHMKRDGSDKLSGETLVNLVNATANADGVIASAHQGGKFILHDRSLKDVAGNTDFLFGDAFGYQSPGWVEAGASGDFYGFDRYRSRILRISPSGKLIQAYQIFNDPQGQDKEATNFTLTDFRVCEGKNVFYVAFRNGEVRCLQFDGKIRWKQKVSLARPWPFSSECTAFDTDAEGNLYLLENGSDTVKVFSPQGEALPPVKLEMGENRPAKGEHWFNILRVCENELILRRAHGSEFFQRYDLQSGKLKQIVSTSHERLTVSFSSSTWTAGQAVPFDIRFDAGGKSAQPRWRVWLRPFNTVRYSELPLADGKITVPGDAAGLCQLKVTPGLDGATAEYMVQSLVEIRKAGAKAWAAVLTDGNRTSYGRGEEIPISVIFRGADGDMPKTYTLQFTDGTRVIAEAKGDMPKEKRAKFLLSRELTSALRPGSYALNVAADGLTCVSLPLLMGPGFENRSPFHLVQHGDYGCLFPVAGVWDTPEKVARHVARSAKLGTDLFVDRVGKLPEPGCGHMMYWQNTPDGEPWLNDLQARLEKNPLAPPPEKARIESTFQQTMAGYSANGISEMGILMIMDAGLPIGTSFDTRKPEQFEADITKVTQFMLPYSAFRGWSWTANWWVWGKLGADVAQNEEQRKAYTAALKQAEDSGIWNPVLDQVSDIWLNYAVKGQDFFNGVLKKIAPDKVTASSGPYRNITVYPPITFSNIQEVDLQFQSEQITPPQVYTHNVDFQKRPSKPAWGHPELWNDGGTGDYILPTLFQMVMRGADGVGNSGPIPPWGLAQGIHPEDARNSAVGTPSVFRAINGLLKSYGPWLTTLQPSDPVAIVGSPRMFRIDDKWVTLGGRHFLRLLEANQSCFYAHRPASFVFLEDMKPDTLAKYKAVLVVDQRVELEPELAKALTAAKAAGVAVFYDDTCRKEIVKDFTPLGVAFNHLETDPSGCWQDDAAYWRFPAYFLANMPAIKKALGAAVPPPAEVDNPEVLLSERVAGDGRFLFVVNNTSPMEVEPGLIWRVTLGMATRVPVQTPVRLNARDKAIYDVFALRRVQPGADGAIVSDLRSLPSRLYAVLPREIAEVTLSGPKAISAGQSFQWVVSVVDSQGKPISTTIPLRLRLLNEQGDVLEERSLAAASGKTDGFSTAPLNPLSGKLTLEATELFSGKQARLSFAAAPQAAPVALSAQPVPANVAAAKAAAIARGKDAGTSPAPAESKFGPHVRDIALSSDGTVALFNAMNWDNNLYSVDTASGKVLSRQRVGNWFAFAPQPAAKGFAVQGYDLNTAEGYHLYLTGGDGKPERRFALFGLPKRLPIWCVAGSFCDHINNFAVPTDGSWVASAGNLGLAVWSRDGKQLWSKDWWRTDRHTLALMAPDANTLLAMSGMTVTAHAAQNGDQLWQVTLAPSGEILDGITAADGKTIALRTTADGGSIFVLRNGKFIVSFATMAREIAFSSDATRLVVVMDDQLKLYSLDQGFQWSFTGDDVMHFARVSPDGRRIAVSSELGTFYVLDSQGAVLRAQDMGAIAALTWMPDGDLLLGTWMGTACRLDGKYAERWRVRLQPEATDMRGKLAAKDSTPTVRMTQWGNAEAAPAALTPNLLKECNALIEVRHDPHSPGDPLQLQNKMELLTDGKPEAPEKPWIGWNEINGIDDSGSNPKLGLQIDAGETQLKVTGITFVEDPKHPESWLRDVVLEHWDAGKEQWVRDQYLVSDAAIHTHKLNKPVEATRFRLERTEGGGPWPAGNIRLGELVFHGESSRLLHPDVAAKKPVAVLFDEQERDMKSLIYPDNGFSFKYDGAFSGKMCMAKEVGSKPAYPYPIDPRGGCTVPFWDFEIVETPQPGQYRYLQFAWKATSPATTGIALLIGRPWPSGGGVSVVAGKYTWQDNVSVVAEEVAAKTPPTEWQVVRVDLWSLVKKPMRIQCLSLATVGGPALFDQILLGKTKEDLQAVGPVPAAGGR